MRVLSSRPVFVSTEGMSSLAEALASTFITNREGIVNAVVESCPVPMFVADTSGKWVHVNLHYQKLLGHTEERLRGDGWLTTIKAEHRSHLAEFWRHIVGSRVAVSHLQVIHDQGYSTGGMVMGFMNIGYVPSSGFVGWFVPICSTPSECPLHGFLLHNVVYGSGEPVTVACTGTKHAGT